jgi:hypothetical protein
MNSNKLDEAVPTHLINKVVQHHGKACMTKYLNRTFQQVHKVAVVETWEEAANQALRAVLHLLLHLLMLPLVPETPDDQEQTIAVEVVEVVTVVSILIHDRWTNNPV